MGISATSLIAFKELPDWFAKYSALHSNEIRLLSNISSYLSLENFDVN